MQTEFVIVGAGIVGAASAYELARRGAEVSVLEAERIAAGASGGPGQRGVRSNARDPRELPLARRAHEIWPGLAAELGCDPHFEPRGGLALFESDRGQDLAESHLRAQRAHGIETHLLDAQALREIEPGVSGAVRGALYCPAEGSVDHEQVTLAYAAAARRHGARIVEGMRVATLETDGERVRALRTLQGERVQATRGCLLAANSGVAPLLETLGVRLAGGAVLPQILFTEPAAGLGPRHLLGHLERLLAAKALADERIMISGGRLGEWREGLGVALPERVAANRADAIATLPKLEHLGVAAAFADRPEWVCPGLVPLIDTAPHLPNLWVATGFSGHGFAIAPVVARLLADWLLDGARPYELAPFGWR